MKFAEYIINEATSPIKIKVENKIPASDRKDMAAMAQALSKSLGLANIPYLYNVVLVGAEINKDDGVYSFVFSGNELPTRVSGENVVNSLVNKISRGVKFSYGSYDYITKMRSWDKLRSKFFIVIECVAIED